MVKEDNIQELSKEDIKSISECFKKIWDAFKDLSDKIVNAIQKIVDVFSDWWDNLDPDIKDKIMGNYINLTEKRKRQHMISYIIKRE